MMTAISASKKTSKPINEQLQCLMEVFPTWKAEDLNAVLNEVGGDAYLAISRISEGHVSQWSDGKKAPAPEESFVPQRTQQRKQQQPQTGRTTDRPARRNETNPERKPPVNKKPVQETKKTVNYAAVAEVSNLSWDSPAPSPVAKVASPSKPTKTSFADALTASTKPTKAKKTERTEEEKIEQVNVVVPEAIVAAVAEEIAAPVVTEDIAAVAAEPEKIATENVPCEQACSCSAEVIEDDCVVQLPSRPNVPSLKMEQPAVILPIRVPMRTGLSVRFGFDREEGVEAPTVSTSSSTATESPAPTEHVTATKTSISVAALESSFAMLSPTEPKPTVSKSPEPAFFEASNTPAYLHQSSASPQPQVSASTSAYGRGRSGWDYEATSNASSFGPAPGFSGSAASASSVAPRMNHRASNYESGYSASYATGANRYAASYDYQSHQAEMHQSFTAAPSTGANNNVSQYYTSNPSNRSSNVSSSYQMYNRPASSFNTNSSGNRYSSGLNRANPGASVAGTTNVPSSSAHYYQPHQQHYAAAPYSAHQSYLSHQGYHAQEQAQPQHQQSHLYSHQPYYQPYQPPHQYLSNNSNNSHGNL